MKWRAGLSLAVIPTLWLGGCKDPVAPTADHRQGLFSARPHTPSGTLFEPGRHTLDLGLEREPVVYVPESHDPDTPAPLVVLFHGAGGSAENWVSPYDHADRLGLVLLIMQSRHGTWDLMSGGLGPDVAATDRALDAVFERVAIDPRRIVFGGFSDGASYALSLGLANPGLVRHLIALSPGFEIGARGEPKPRIFVAHGTADRVLPVHRTRTLVQRLLDEGYDVTYREFTGGHGVPSEISTAAFDWLAATERVPR